MVMAGIPPQIGPACQLLGFGEQDYIRLAVQLASKRRQRALCDVVFAGECEHDCGREQAAPAAAPGGPSAMGLSASEGAALFPSAMKPGGLPRARKVIQIVEQKYLHRYIFPARMTVGFLWDRAAPATTHGSATAVGANDQKRLIVALKAGALAARIQ
jgi:hypothetical protein